MKKVLRINSRVLSAVLAATMIFTSMPITSITAYADEGMDTAEIVDDVVVDGGDILSDAEDNSDIGAVDGDATDDDTPASGDTEEMPEHTVSEDPNEDLGIADAEMGTDSEEEIISEEESAYEEAILEIESDDTMEIQMSDVTEATLSSEDDYTWDDTTITGLSGEYSDDANITLVIPEKATALAANAFSDRSCIVSVSFAGDNIDINEYAFSKCSRMINIDLPDNLTMTGERQFYYCKSLTEIDLPDSLKMINAYAFSGCSSLARISIPDSVKYIREGAFSSCKALTSIKLPSELEEISNSTFGGCTGLTKVVLPEGLTRIGAYAFNGCTSLKEIDLPEGLRSIGTFAFYDCSGLTELCIPSSVTECRDAIHYCSSLTYVEYAEGTTDIAWVRSQYVTTIKLPSTIEIINVSSFSEVPNLASINLPASIKRIRYNAFGSSDKPLDYLTELRFEGTGDIAIENDAFAGMGQARTVKVYCAVDSKVYNYFIDRDGFQVISDNTIKYVLDGGTNDSRNPGIYTSGDDITLYDPVKSGYIFDGWYTDSSCTEPFVYDRTSTSGNITLYAKWSENIYQITYDLNGGALPKGKTNPDTYTVTKDYPLVSPAKVGADFVGWRVNYTDHVITDNRIVRGSCTGNLTLTAHWRDYVYRIIWDKNAKDATGTMDAACVGVWEEYKIPAGNYERSGYDLVSWNTKANGKGTSYAPGDVIQGLKTTDGATITLYAQWQKGLHEITYELNGGTNNKSNPDSYTDSQKINLKSPTKAGYTFAGWYTDSTFINKVTQISSVLGDVTVYAAWTANSYTINYNKNKGTGTMSAVKVDYDQSVALSPNVYTRTGYTFDGWNTKANGSGTTYEDCEIVTELVTQNNAKVTLYAQWVATPYGITYENVEEANNSTNPEIYTIEKDVVLKNPTMSGYTFKGWYLDAAHKQKITKISKATGEDITIFAAWKENSYTIKFSKNGGTYTIPAATKYVYSADIMLPDGTDATRTNYELTGWNTKANRSGIHYDLNERLTCSDLVQGLKNNSTVTLYAEWTPVANRTYTITYTNVDDWDNSGNPETYSFERNVSLKNPTKEGYTFKGWYLNDADGKKVTTISKSGTCDVTLFGVWTENSYTISYNANKGTLVKGSKMSGQTVSYMESVELIENLFTRKGFMFTGWNTKANGSGDSYDDCEVVERLIAKNKGKITLYAQWGANEYDITYVNVDGADNSANREFYTIAKDVKLANPSLYGYTFKGWYSDAGCTNKIIKIAKATCADITVYAKWEENRYNLRFATNTLFGTDVKSVMNRLYTEYFNIPSTEPAKDGYTFKGWALTRNGEVLYQPNDTVSFEELHEAGGTAKGLVGTKYVTLYAVFAENT